MTISAKLVFLSEGGNGPEVKPQDFSFQDFYTNWSHGSIIRDFEVELEDEQHVQHMLESDPNSPEFRQLGELILNAFLPIHNQLSLPYRLLTYMEFLGGDQVRCVISSDTTDSRKVFWVDDHLKGEIRSDEFSRTYLCTLYSIFYELKCRYDKGYLDHDVPPSTTTEIIHNFLYELFDKITNQDNCNFLTLLQEAAVSSNKETIQFDTPLSLNIFSHLQMQMARWGIPVSTCLVTAEMLSEFPLKDLSGRYINDIKVASEEPFQIRGIDVICLGSPYDFIYPLGKSDSPIYFCAPPSTLGIQAISYTFRSDLVDKRILGESTPGWFYHAYKSMAITNSRGVVAANRVYK